MTRGHRGSLLLRCRAPSSLASWRFIRALCEHTFVRWESQTVTTDDAGRLPGLGEDVVIRRFDAPEALDMRFHEIRT
jgi:hypothetical protein